MTDVEYPQEWRDRVTEAIAVRRPGLTSDDRAANVLAVLAEIGALRADTPDFKRGVATGRAQAAADIRNAPYPDPSPCIPAWHAGYTEATATAARIAETVVPHA